MASSSTQFVARHVHDMVERQRLDALDDCNLLNRFLDSRDEASFAAIVRRHGPMILGTCRRVLHHVQDAEDACQATFLVLARKGGTVRGTHCLAGWLHRVGVRIALRLRKERANRTLEPLPEDLEHAATTADETMWRDVRGTFDAEVGRLPERLRLPLVLCILEGRTRQEAASFLGWTEGTVRGRLERGRRVLRSRFTRKGLTLPTALLPLVVNQAAPAAVPTSSVATKLAESVIRSMTMAKVKLVGWVSTAVLLMGTGVGLGLFDSVNAQPKASDPPSKAAEPAKPSPLSDAEKNLETFVIRVSLAPQGEGKFDPKYTLYHAILYVPNLRLEPSANGPTGKPIEAHIKITKEEAKKILAALKENEFFAEQGVGAGARAARDKSHPHASISVRYQGGEDPTEREAVYPWKPEMLKSLDAIRAAVDGEAAKVLDTLLGQLAEERKKWFPEDLAADLKMLQGNWIEEPKLHDALPTHTVKCSIDGKKITLKPYVQLQPLLDLETIRGTLELAIVGKGKAINIEGTRDTVSKTSPGNWSLPYTVTDTTLTINFPGGNEPLDGNLYPLRLRDRQVVLKRVPTKIASEWGESSNGVSSRIRTTKLKYLAGETPTFDLDVRDMTPGISGVPFTWRGDRGHLTVEINGVSYGLLNTPGKKAATRDLALGETVQSWTTLNLAEDFRTVDGATGVVKKLMLTPGKYKVRVGSHFDRSNGGPGADPVSGPLEIEVVQGVSSSWGTPVDGLMTRIRSAKAQFQADEPIALELDVAGFGDEKRSWYAGTAGYFAHIEVDGMWHDYKYDTFEKMVYNKLVAGREHRSWATVIPSSDWVRVKPPGRRSDRELILDPGQHTIRIGYDFAENESKPLSIRAITGPLEIEILPPANQPPPTQTWIPKKEWKPFKDGGPTGMVLSPDGKLLAAYGFSEIAIWNMTRAEPIELGRRPNEGFRLLGFDSTGTLVLLNRQPAEFISQRSPYAREGKPIGGVPVRIVECPAEAKAAISPDGRSLALFDKWGQVRIIDLGFTKGRSMDAPEMSPGSAAFPHSLQFSPDGKLLIGLGNNDYPVDDKANGCIVCWEVASGKILWQSEESDGQRTAVFTKDGKSLATGGRGGDITIWNAANGKKIKMVPADTGEVIGLFADGKTLVTSSHTRKSPQQPILQVWDLSAEKPFKTVQPTKAAVREIVVREDGKSFVTADIAGGFTWWIKQDLPKSK